MDCESCRISVSARLDSEPGAAPAEQVEAHLSRCAACRAWQAEATALTRSLRVRPAVATPDLVDVVLDRFPRRLPVLRRSLGAVAVAQLLLGLAQMLGFGTHGHHEMSAHLFNESTAWNVAVGAGLLWAAIRTRAVAGMLPVLGVFLLVLTGFSLYDLITGVVTLDRVASHGLMLIGLGLLCAVHWTGRGHHPGGSAGSTGHDHVDLPPYDDLVPGEAPPTLRPTAQERRAA
ncbi:zf-HC2 domain-containing protein [Saccharopolyspora taberi]|uniref:Zf-HC2 domain-containing protein n=1 Tax=Saccharopolyspora taberi TaxID=60895 RepID=A0ABN3VKJ6_9PSEU